MAHRERCRLSHANLGRLLIVLAGLTRGSEPEPATRDSTFDGFPTFDPTGRGLVFASNLGAKARGETNLFVAEWRR